MVIHEQSKNALVLPAQQQVIYVLDFETGEILNSAANGNDNTRHKYRYQIDSRGNVKIEHTCGSYWQGQLTWSRGQTRLSISDNIPIPTYIIDMLKEVIYSKVDHSSGFWEKNVINAFNKIKSGLKELANNPLDATDIKSQLGFSMNKNEILQNELKEMEQKCKNIQAAYVDTLKDNEKIKQEKAELNEKLKKEIEDLKATNTKITATSQAHAAAVKCLLSHKIALLEELEKSRSTRHYTSEFGPEFEPEFEPEFGNKFKTDYTHTHSLQDCYHNPGGATIYTKANAMNRMVFNPLLGIYEPGEDK